ncbi:IS4 family transposase [Enterocloster lavalensis]|uniref:IS4 family transposase n=1 Tax=Enterocloster lavalensis TaxID=460384 RepID=UPI00266676BD|nr:IS4 family transposase [Enterocloster lavalensis]
MSHEFIKAAFSDAVNHVASNISRYVINPDKDLTRNRKIGAANLISFMVSCGASSTKLELLDFFGLAPIAPSASAFNQQRAKLKPDALEAVFHQFNSSVLSMEKTTDYRFLTADGSTFTFFSKPSFSTPEYFVSEGHSAKGFYSMHLNALYDLHKHTYTDALIQPIHQKDEFRAFCDMVDRHALLPDTRDVLIGDRGYCSYNNMAHIMEKNQYFLFRTKDIHSKGLVGNFDFPDTDSFDILVNVTLVRSHKKTIPIKEGFYKRFVDADASFDYVAYGSLDTYDLSFRIIRFPISNDSYECAVTNLPPAEFPVERIKLLYYARWGIESSFRKLKYTIGLSNFHAYKPDYIKQEIWAKLITYNMTETLINHTIIKKGKTKHEYKVNFSMAAHICRVFLRLTAEKDPIDVMSLLCRELIPIRNEHHYPRLKTAHFRKPRYFIYRAV